VVFRYIHFRVGAPFRPQGGSSYVQVNGCHGCRVCCGCSRSDTGASNRP